LLGGLCNAGLHQCRRLPPAAKEMISVFASIFTSIVQRLANLRISN
jgi:hypothetical protein